MTKEPSPPGVEGRRATIRDVATLVGVDPSLVSRVVNNDPKASASEATRKRILDAVDQLGYSANVVARSLRMAKTFTLGLLLPDLSNPMYASIVHGVESQARLRGYGVVLGSHVDGDGDDTFTRLLQQKRVDGLLVASGLLRDDFMRRISAGSGPIVLVNRRVPGVKSSVVVDDLAGAKMAVAHLAELGHRSVAGLFGPSDIDTTIRRRKGFEEGCREAGIKPVVVEMASWNSESGYLGGLSQLAPSGRPTGIFASTLAMAIGVLRAAREIGLDVPTDVSMVGLHDSELADYLAPPLTTVWMPTEEMGAKSVDLLLDLIDGKPPRQVMVRKRPQLVLRRSTAAPISPAVR